MVVINPEKHEPNIGDLGMQEALRKIHDEILNVLEKYEKKADQERYANISLCLNKNTKIWFKRTNINYVLHYLLSF